MKARGQRATASTSATISISTCWCLPADASAPQMSLRNYSRTADGSSPACSQPQVRTRSWRRWQPSWPNELRARLPDVDTSELVGTNPTGELMTSGLLIIRPQDADIHTCQEQSHDSQCLHFHVEGFFVVKLVLLLRIHA